MCPACLGSGRVSERIPASDALADAETLRAWADSLPIRRGQLCGKGARVAWLIYAASDGSLSFAHLAARDAFLAVPGLRESAA